MFFSRKYRLSIPEPCQQGWESMQPERNGRFCGSCAKTVVDFTVMSEKEIAAYFRNRKTGVCGRFEIRQMEMVYKTNPRIKLPLHQRISAFIISLFVSNISLNKAMAQSGISDMKGTDTVSAPAMPVTYNSDSTAIAAGDTLPASADSAVSLVIDTGCLPEFRMDNFTVETITFTLGYTVSEPVEEGPSFMDLFKASLKRSVLPKGIVLEKGEPEKPQKPEKKSTVPIEAILAEETKKKGNKRV